MRLLYAAIDQRVPGTTGGSIHVEAVARGLAALGHDVHVLVAPGDGRFPGGPVTWIPMQAPFGAARLRWARRPAAARWIRRLAPDAVIERYYNFGGEAVTAAAAAGVVSVLEVNAPVIDHPGSRKAMLDRMLLVQPMRRWREHLCELADLLVTPSRAILPAGVTPGKILEAEWGADTDSFHPDAAGPLRFERPDGMLAVFAGAFRSWHGAVRLVRAVRRLREHGRRDVAALFIGDGPELAATRAAAAGLDNVLFTGAIPHSEMPAHLAAADVGVAPFDPAAHAPLALGFYWSPLKIFEYMASGLPVVAPAVDRLPALVRHDVDGLLYGAADEEGLARALADLTDPVRRRRLAAAARARAVADFSWTAHCRLLERAIAEAVARRRGRR